MQGDIRTYFQNSLSDIVRGSEQPLFWPPPDKLEILLERSNRLFIYTPTALRYIGVPDVDFRERLKHITRLTPARMQTGVIDSFYNEIVRQASHCELEPEEVSRRHMTLCRHILVDTLVSGRHCKLVRYGHPSSSGRTVPIRSVIQMPTAGTSPVTIFHSSFPDFIVDPSRCEKHHLDVSEGHQKLAVKCLQWLNQAFERNLYPLDRHMTRSFSHEPNAISEALRYSVFLLALGITSCARPCWHSSADCSDRNPKLCLRVCRRPSAAPV